MDAEKLGEILEIEDEEKIGSVLQAIQEETQGLVRNKEALLGEVKELKKKMKNFEGIDVEEYQQMKEELERLQTENEQSQNGQSKSNTKDELKAMEERLTKKYGEQMNRKDEELSNLRSRYYSTLIGQELRSAIEKVSVADEHRGLIFNAFRNSARVEDIDGQPTVQLTTQEGLKLTPTEFFKDWAASEEGKRYIKAPGNSGGDAVGGRGSKGGVKEISRAEFDKKPPAERAQLMRDKVRLVD